MSRGSVFDYDAIGKALKTLRPDPYLKPAEPLPAADPDTASVGKAAQFGLCHACLSPTYCSSLGCAKRGDWEG